MFLSRTTTTILGAGLGLSLSFTLLPSSPFSITTRPIQCQYTSDSSPAANPAWTVDPQDPLVRKNPVTAKNGSRILTASNMRQVSLGSVLGLVVGVGLRAFSRALVVLIGMGIVVVEWAASKGYNILPINRMQKYVKNVDLQKAVSKHVPFKITFGATMALAAFAQF